MTELDHPLERSARAWLTLIQADPQLQAEFLHSRAEFCSGSALGEDPLARRRHLEWFVMERSSEVLSGLVVQVLPQLHPEAFEASELAAWIGSQVGVFEVTSVRPGEGFWLRDLASAGEYPLHEPGASQLVEAGDLIAGRLFPIDGAFQASPAAAFVRDPALLDALQADFEQARASRRGVLRVSQAQIESLFHSASASAHDEVQGAIERARELLRAGGLEAEEIEEVFEALALEPMPSQHLTPGAQDTLGQILDRLAFETDIDLETARQALLAAWREFSQRGAGQGKSIQPMTAPAAKSQRPSKTAAQALADYDAQRQAGTSVDKALRELELALGLDPEEEEDPGLAPDFPDAVAAIVQEFLWELETSAGPQARAECAILESLGAYARPLGVFDALDERQLVDYCSRWIIESDQLRSSEDAARFVRALERFDSWSRESGAIELWSGFGEYLKTLNQSLPRLAELNQRRTRRAGSDEGELLRIQERQGEAWRLQRLASQATAEVEVDPMLGPWLRPGDLVRGELRGLRLALYAAYPSRAQSGQEPPTGI